MSILSPEDLALERERLRAEGKVVVQCHGCFDIVHPGHIRYLRYAKSLGDALIISVTSDRCIDKGFDRPFFPQGLRTDSLAALEFVDFVCLDDHATAGEILGRLRPDIYVKGKEYETSQDPRFLHEKRLVEGYGGQVVYSSGDVVFSSTRLLERLRGQVSIDGEKIRVFCEAHGITRAAVDGLLDRFAGLRMTVVGDPILDRYIHADEANVASESPVISVTEVEREVFLGGAGLIAAQATHLGADVRLITTLDRSDTSARFRELAERRHVHLEVIEEPRRPVFRKTRYLVQEQMVFKVDEGQRAPLASAAASRLTSAIEEALERSDLLVLTDFGYGLFSSPAIAAIGEAARQRSVPCFVDVSRGGSSNLLRFQRPRLATPTETELRLALGDLEAGLSNLAARYYEQTDAERLIITMGRRGSLMLGRPPQLDGRLVARHLPAFDTHPVDSAGAGDTFLCAAALADVAGASPELGLYLGTVLAALHVSRLGNDPSSVGQLVEALDGRPELVE